MLDSHFHETSAASTKFILPWAHAHDTKPDAIAGAPHSARSRAVGPTDHGKTLDEPNAASTAPWLLLWTI
jgi:hypothetical protein